MNRRIELDQKLSAIAGVQEAYFNAPTNVKMRYPCIRYARTGEQVRFACNGRFIVRDRYMLTVIDRNPESSILKSLEEFPYYSFDRMYTADGLNHFVCTIYY